MGGKPVLDQLNREWPDKVHFEVTTRCNLLCYMCRDMRPTLAQAVKLCDGRLNSLKKLFPFVKKCQDIGLFGWGEPLFHPEIREFIKACGKNVNVVRYNNTMEISPKYRLTTNGTLLSKEVSNLLVKNNFYAIDVSMDSPYAKTYEMIRKGANFEDVVRNVKSFQETKRRQEKDFPSLGIEFVAMKQNIEQLPDMVLFAKDVLGADYLIVVYVVIVTPGLENESLFYHQELANKIFEKTKGIAQELKFQIILPPSFGSRIEPENYCDEIYRCFYVQTSGKVIPCCSLTESYIGDINRQRPEEIWNGEMHQVVKEDFKQGKIKKCRTCSRFIGNDINKREVHILV